MTFDEWLMTQNTPEWAITSREIMRKAWDVATTTERDRCKEKCEQLWLDKAPPQNLTFHGVPIEFTGTFDYYKDVYTQGWLDACNKCGWAIHGKSQPYTEDELSKAAKIGKAYFDNNKLIDIQMDDAHALHAASQPSLYTSW